MKDYSVLDGITRNMKDCLITAYNKGYSRGYEDGWAVRSEYEPKGERQKPHSLLDAYFQMRKESHE